MGKETKNKNSLGYLDTEFGELVPEVVKNF